MDAHGVSDTMGAGAELSSGSALGSSAARRANASSTRASVSTCSSTARPRPVAWNSAVSTIGRYWDVIRSAARLFGTPSTRTSCSNRKGRTPGNQECQAASASSARTRVRACSQIRSARSSSDGESVRSRLSTGASTGVENGSSAGAPSPLRVVAGMRRWPLGKWCRQQAGLTASAERSTGRALRQEVNRSRPVGVARGTHDPRCGCRGPARTLERQVVARPLGRAPPFLRRTPNISGASPGGHA